MLSTPMRPRHIATICAVLALAACNRPAQKAEAPKAPTPPAAAAPAAPVAPGPTAPEGFRHQADFDATGYYMPIKPVRTGVLELTNITVGGPNDFAEWERGARQQNYGPLLMEFDDTSSPMQPNEMGGETRAISVRILPTAYDFNRETIAFVGSDARVGKVVFIGHFDAAALRAALRSGESDSVRVLTGQLQIGGQIYNDVSFSYFAGD